MPKGGRWPTIACTIVERGHGGDAILGASPGGSNEPGGRPSAAEQNNRGRMPISDRGRDMPVRVRREDRG